MVGLGWPNAFRSHPTCVSETAALRRWRYKVYEAYDGAVAVAAEVMAAQQHGGTSATAAVAAEAALHAEPELCT